MNIVVSIKKSRLKRIVAIILIVLVSYSAVSMVVTKLVYDGIYAQYDEPISVPPALEYLVSARQTVQYPSGDNLLTGYYYPTDNAHGLVILVPGFQSGGDSYLWQIESLLDYGWSVFTFDVTGTYRSQGENQVGFSQPLLDLRSTLKYVEKNRNFGYNDLVLMGHSQGGYAVCCALAQETDVSAVVSISGINSPMEGVMQTSSDTIGPIAYGNYGFLWLYQAMLFGKDTLELEACDAISQSQVPVLVIHGTMDEKIPADTCAIIAYQDQIQSENAQFLLCQAGHTDILYDDDGTANDALMAQIHEFLIQNVESR